MTNADFHAVRSLFDAALAHAPDLREAFLDDAALRQPEVAAEARELLRFHLSQDEDFVERLQVACMKVDEELPGPVCIGPYRIVGKLGEGGMGAVYLAEQTKPLRRQVALKLIRRGRDTRSVIARFEQERQALAVMDHDGIAKVYDCGTSDAGQPYFVMELVHGVSLTTYCDQQRLGLRERLQLVQQVCVAVQHAHQKGVVHRDLKPANILVVDDGAKRQVKVIDFGLAKAMERPLLDAALQTEIGDVLGTPEYMAPEQVDGGNTYLDTRVDVYSIGVILFEVLVGSLPFDSATLRSQGWAAMMRTIREVEAPRPSQRLGSAGAAAAEVAARCSMSTSSLLKALREDLDWVVARSLEKERDRRYASVAALAEDLQRFLDQEPVVAGPPSAGYRLKKFVRRRRLEVGATVAVLITALAGGGASLWYANLSAAHLEDLQQRRGQDLLRNGAAAARMGRWQDAEVLFAEAKSFPATEIEALIAEAEMLEARLCTDEAAEALRDLAQRQDLGAHRACVELLLSDPTRPSVTFAVRPLSPIEAALASGTLEPANEAYARAILASSSQEALASVAAALQADPYHRRAREMFLTMVLLERGFAASIPVVDSYLDEFPGDPCATICKALCLSHLGSESRCREVLEQAGLGDGLKAGAMQAMAALDEVTAFFSGQARDFAIGYGEAEKPSSANGVWRSARAIRSLSKIVSDVVLPLRFPPRVLDSLCSTPRLFASVAFGNKVDIAQIEVDARSCSQSLFPFVQASLLPRAGGAKVDVFLSFRKAAFAPGDLFGLRYAAQIYESGFCVSACREAALAGQQDKVRELGREGRATISRVVAQGLVDAQDLGYYTKLASMLDMADPEGAQPGLTTSLAARWLSVAPDLPGPRVHLAVALARLGRVAAARALIDGVVAEAPELKLARDAKAFIDECPAPAPAPAAAGGK